jgi:hypothetical protein
MVGAPRSAVTSAAAVLRRDRAIDYQRGVVNILNEARLRKAACECYDGVSQAAAFQPVNGSGAEALDR